MERVHMHTMTEYHVGLVSCTSNGQLAFLMQVVSHTGRALHMKSLRMPYLSDQQASSGPIRTDPA